MKPIETLYAVLTDENGEETIAAYIPEDSIQFQCASSKLGIINRFMEDLKRVAPEKRFEVVEFKRVVKGDLC